MLEFKYYKKQKYAKDPVISTKNSAGIDFFAPDEIDADNVKAKAVFFKKDIDNNICVTIPPGMRVKFYTGVHVKFPNNHVLLGRDRSSLATKKGLHIIAGVIDSDYQGEIIICLHNISNKSIVITSGEKIAQFILVPIPKVNLIECVNEIDIYPEITDRAEGGFGSTGK